MKRMAALHSPSCRLLLGALSALWAIRLRFVGVSAVGSWPSSARAGGGGEGTGARDGVSSPGVGHPGTCGSQLCVGHDTLPCPIPTARRLASQAQVP